MTTQENLFPPAPIMPPLAEVYVYLMGDIEPDFLKTQAELDAQYSGETTQEHAAREARYQAADVAFKQAYKDYIETYKHALTRYNRDTNKQFEFFEELALLTAEVT